MSTGCQSHISSHNLGVFVVAKDEKYVVISGRCVEVVDSFFFDGLFGSSFIQSSHTTQ